MSWRRDLVFLNTEASMHRTRLLLLTLSLATAGAVQGQRCDVTQVKENIASCDSYFGESIPGYLVLRGWCYLGTSACILF
jgi:hypothetical protein